MPNRTAAKDALLGLLWREKMHVEPRALELSTQAVRDAYAHIWQPAEEWQAALGQLPLGLLAFWAECPRGHLIFTHGPSHYVPGKQTWRKWQLDGICYLSLADLRARTPEPYLAQFALFDHLLGSYGNGDYLSQGTGVTAHLQEVAERFQRVWQLSYGSEEWGVNTAKDYLLKSWWLYLMDSRELSVLAPQAYRFFRTTLMSEVFWTR